MKPPAVAEAVARAIMSFGGVGRGVHEASLDAGMTVFMARQKLSDLFGGPGPKNVAFSSNVTEALNIAIYGLMEPGDHAVTTAASHNSVLRPLFRLQDAGANDVSVVALAPDGGIDYDEFEAAFRPETKLAVIGHASNLTGDVYDIARMADIAHAHGALIIIDAAQTAGTVPIDMAGQHLDIVCFTGHKSLFGPQGTGGLCVAEGIDVKAIKVGGSGTHSYDRTHPDFMPEHLEAGTLNAHGIAGLLAGLAYIEEKGVDAIHRTTCALADRFVQGITGIDGLKIYGGGADGRTGIVALNLADADSSLVADLLNTRYDICTRAGAHCAPLMHQALGTERQGAVRFSFSHLNTEAEVDSGIQALIEISRELS